VESRQETRGQSCATGMSIYSLMRLEVLLIVSTQTTLGPDTGDLTLRIGLHSGPVTAVSCNVTAVRILVTHDRFLTFTSVNFGKGVLRGERSRFQLFGDTVNTGMSK
jgi:hypothetical protein